MFTLSFVNDLNEHFVKEERFPDESLHLSLPIGELKIIIWDYENDAELFTLICIRKHYAQTPALILPYVPHARMDRIKNPTDVFTLKYFCEVINNLNFSEVIIFDPHSNVTPALLDRVTVKDFKVVFNKVYHDYLVMRTAENNLTVGEIENNTIFFYPDEGAMKRYSSIINQPYAFGIKQRNWETGQIEGLMLMGKEGIKGKDVFIVDDICSRGGTFYHSAKALKEAGAKNIYLYISHAENAMITGDMYNSDLITHIFTTASIFNKANDFKNKVSVVNW